MCSVRAVVVARRLLRMFVLKLNGRRETNRGSCYSFHAGIGEGTLVGQSKACGLKDPFSTLFARNIGRLTRDTCRA